MDRAEWLELRRNGVGGSDAPIICGESKWMTPYQLYLEKCGELPEQPENPYMLWGRLLEPVVLSQYQEMTGIQFEATDPIVYHPVIPWMFFSPDAVAEDRIIQAKTARTAEGWGDPGTDEIPRPYIVQVQHEMFVAGKELADVPLLVGGSDFRIYQVEADKELQKLIVGKEEEFWKQVEAKVPPEETSFEDIQQRFGAKSTSLAIQASSKVLETIQNLNALQASIKTAEELMKDGKALVMAEMGEADTLIHGDLILCTWKMDKPGMRFSQKILKEKYPEIFEECQEKKKATRRFLLK